MSMQQRRRGLSSSQHFYRLLLVLYPTEFRRGYGEQMEQAFNDLCRDEARGGVGGALWRVWPRVLMDLARAAPAEHWQSFLQKMGGNKKLRTDAPALVLCAALIVLATSLLAYARSSSVSSLLFYGPILDAFASVGVFGNAITFAAARATQNKSVRLACSVFLAVGVLSCLAAQALGDLIGIRAGWAGLVLAYFVSCSLWCAIHWVAAKS
jgi:hypothetical protein